MTILSGMFCVLCLAVSSLAQQTASEETMSQLSRSAEEQLSRSIQDLNQLREQIATEKLPLAQELTASEEQLAQLRSEHDRVTRLVDSGNLEITNIKSEMQARQDELAYIGNLLDEYARALESKVNVSELQYCGAAIDTAKQAAEDTTLPMPEKFDRQIALADVSLARLTNVIGGMRFPGVGVDLQGTVADGQFAIIGPVALFSATSGGSAGLAIAQSGSTKPLIRPLECPLQTGIAALVETGEGLLPLDPSLGGALKALVQKTNLMHIFKKGGPVMWPLLFASVLALATVLERLSFLLGERLKRDPKAMEAFFAAVAADDTESAIKTSQTSKFYVVRALGYALTHRETSLESALLYAQARELKRYQRGIPILDTVITLAPLLGLLGTVTGMMGSFSLIGGELSSPGAITGGIAEALIATAFGLGIAITALLPFNFLNTRMDNARHEIESAATQLELLMRPQTPGVLAVARLAPASMSSGQSAHQVHGAGSADEVQHREHALQSKRQELRRQIAELQAALENDPFALADSASGGPRGKE